MCRGIRWMTGLLSSVLCSSTWVPLESKSEIVMMTNMSMNSHLSFKTPTLKPLWNKEQWDCSQSTMPHLRRSGVTKVWAALRGLWIATSSIVVLYSPNEQPQHGSKQLTSPRLKTNRNRQSHKLRGIDNQTNHLHMFPLQHCFTGSVCKQHELFKLFKCHVKRNSHKNR